MTNTNKNNIKYLVTGAAGFLGGTICRQLIERGDAVRAFVLKNDPAMKFVPEAAEICEGDLTDMASLSRFFQVEEGTETIVIHCASVVTVNPDFNQTVMNVNVGGTMNIIDQCLAHPECRKLVYVSSTGAIPERPKGQPIREVDHFDDSVLRDCYSQSKALATQAVLDAVRKRGLNACVVHPAVACLNSQFSQASLTLWVRPTIPKGLLPCGIMGPEDFAVGETTSTMIKIINGEMPAGIDGSFNLCDVRDLADGTIRAAEKGRSGECYILGNREVRFRDFARMIAEEAGTKPMRLFLSLGMANLMGKMMEKQAKRKGTKPLMTSFSVYNLARNNCFDSTKAMRELGYRTRSYRETMHDEIQWLIETGNVKAPAVKAAVMEPVPAHA